MVLARAPRSPYYQYMYLFSEVSKLSQIKFFANLVPIFCEDVICYISFLCYVIYLFEHPTRHFSQCHTDKRDTGDTRSVSVTLTRETLVTQDQSVSH